jgi:hypothetical protein
LIKHKDTPQSVGLLWMRDRPVAETLSCDKIHVNLKYIVTVLVPQNVSVLLLPSSVNLSYFCLKNLKFFTKLIANYLITHYLQNPVQILDQYVGCLYLEPQHPTTDHEKTEADISYSSCVLLILNSDFKILRDYFAVYNQVFIVNILCIMWRLSF